MTTETPELKPRDRRNIDDLRLVMTNLANLIETENAALGEHKLDVVKALSANKWTLTRNYRNQMQAIADAPSILQCLEPEERAQLRTLGERLDRECKRNELLLEANIDAANRVMQAMVDGVKQASERGTVYGRTGTIKGISPDGRPLAVSFNREL
ncbi:hypothetical protein KL86APRO_11411 [uncultured Alphaproteobacteria bacterium]|uniref:Flagellar protein FlgN n=1 Tax=uncultured Alphaproteobacteria bacterium TaxID=91750 RepID=A0A212JPG8_9PROT|nr:hypothetical protein KL86APRO_11411 [uncultured Alphaproteobacteria bacterium]